jgi:putative transposase
MNKPLISYKRHRFPPQIIAHAVWLYFRFPLSLRMVEEMLLERGIVVSYETIRRWAKKFGPDYARRLRRKPPGHHDIWHLDEVVITIAGKKHWLWRAVDQDGRPDPAQHQGCQTIVDPAVENARRLAQAHDHRQAPLLRSGQASGHAAGRTPVAQGPQQPSGEFACAAAKTGTNNAGLPITWIPAAVRLNLLRRSQSLRSSPFKTLSIRNPPPPPESHVGVESRDRNAGLKSSPQVSSRPVANNVTSPVEGIIQFGAGKEVIDQFHVLLKALLEELERLDVIAHCGPETVGLEPCGREQDLLATGQRRGGKDAGLADLCRH